MLRSVVWQLVTNVLGQPIGLVFKSGPETSVTNFQSMLRDITEEQRYLLHRDGSLKSRIKTLI
jgi:hypothetical protein